MELEIIKLSEISQTEDQYHKFSLVYGIYVCIYIYIPKKSKNDMSVQRGLFGKGNPWEGVHKRRGEWVGNYD
jgi:hypothetical protein